MLKAALIGGGAVAAYLIPEFIRRRAADVVSVYDIEEGKAALLISRFGLVAEEFPPDEAKDICEVLVECAHPDAVEGVVRAAAEKGIPAVVLSVAGLVRHPELARLEGNDGFRLIVPSGAVAGMDYLRALPPGEIRTVTLTTVKPPAAFPATPEMAKLLRGVSRARERVTIFDGDVNEATRLFPKNINVAATIALAGIGPERTRVRVVADPKARRNTHTLVVASDAGEMAVTLENLPLEENPGTSRIAALSVLNAILSIEKRLLIGGN
jgi:aspartate dehydrogenase